VRRALDGLYEAAGWLAALSVLGIATIVTAQVALNAAARIGGPAWSATIPSYADLAGFALAAATFLALATTLRHGVHIRVNLVVRMLPARIAWAVECVVLAAAAAIAAYATWWSGVVAWESWHYGDTSSGMVAVPLWAPQGFMVAGLAIFTVALADTLVEAIRAGRPVLRDENAE
jgi:TRAP-type C4-dicarboxylate transport system permease small subunit